VLLQRVCLPLPTTLKIAAAAAYASPLPYRKAIPRSAVKAKGVQTMKTESFHQENSFVADLEKKQFPDQKCPKNLLFFHFWNFFGGNRRSLNFQKKCGKKFFETQNHFSEFSAEPKNIS